jgi:hypothetical protein
MTVSVSMFGLEEYTEKGYVLVGITLGVDDDKRFHFANPKTTCLHTVKGWKEGAHHHLGFCLLDKEHHGRHSTVAFSCDCCGKTRRGRPQAVQYDVNGDVAVVACFMCSIGET